MRTDKIKKTAGLIGKALALLIICFNILTVLLTAADFRWLPYTVLTIESGSMEPELSPGDLVVIHETDYLELEVGDDVTFITVDELVTHRIIGVESGGYITRGIANNAEDPSPMDASEYCGKVVMVIHGVGSVLSFVTRPYVLPALAVLIALCCFGSPLTARLRKQGERFRASGLMSRSLVCLCAVSILMSLPAVTAAKYTVSLQHSELAVADAMYFSSNYLSEGDGNIYSIQGWNGKAYPLSLEIRNYDNDLLFNGQGMHVTYDLSVERTVDSSYSGAYTVDVSIAEGTSAIGEGQTYLLPGGAKTSHSFDISIVPQLSDGSTALPPNTRIQFVIRAKVSDGQNYDEQLLGTFRMQVAESTDFIGRREVSDMGNMVGLSLFTNLVNEGSDERVVAFRWDPARLYLNEFERTAFNIINNYPDNYYNKEQGILYMNLQAFSRVNLEFFKRDNEDKIDGNSFVIQVVEKVGDIPAALPVQTPAPEQNEPADPPEPTDAGGGGADGVN